MTLLRLSIDLRKAALEKASTTPGATVDIIDNNGKKIAVVWPDADRAYNSAGEIVDRCNKYPALLASLRRLAIVDRHMKGIQKVVYDGKRCRLCHSEWGDSEKEHHRPTCVLESTNDD